MKKIILTGFEPFRNEKVNVSWETIKDYENSDIILKKILLPVVFKKASSILIEEINKFNPDYVVMFGEAGGRNTITLEKIALNYMDASIEDNEGNKFLGKKSEEIEQNAYFTSLPLEKIEQDLKDNRIPSYISKHAGTYVCNNIMFDILNHINQNNLSVKAGFIHLPYYEENVFDKKLSPFLPLEYLKKALNIIVNSL